MSDGNWISKMLADMRYDAWFPEFVEVAYSLYPSQQRLLAVLGVQDVGQVYKEITTRVASKYAVGWLDHTPLKNLATIFVATANPYMGDTDTCLNTAPAPTAIFVDTDNRYMDDTDPCWNTAPAHTAIFVDTANRYMDDTDTCLNTAPAPTANQR